MQRLIKSGTSSVGGTAGTSGNGLPVWIYSTAEAGQLVVKVAAYA